MENIYRRLEAWGYPKPGTDWLRKQRLVVIIVLAIIAWVGLMGLVWLAFQGAVMLVTLIGSAWG